jgi:hypothetical protein
VIAKRFFSITNGFRAAPVNSGESTLFAEIEVPFDEHFPFKLRRPLLVVILEEAGSAAFHSELSFLERSHVQSPNIHVAKRHARLA